MFVKFEILFIVCYFTGTYSQVRPSCRQIDFNNETSTNEFEPCEDLNVFGIKSYSDVSITPFRSDAEFHLSNIDVGYACIRTIQTFNLDSNTEIDSIIYLNSNPADTQSFVEISAFDTEDGDVYTLGRVIVSDEWNEFHSYFSRSINYAKVYNVGLFFDVFLN